jgi:hypothetical protein
MKKSFLLYLVIFLVLTNLFTYMYFSKSKASAGGTEESVSTEEVLGLRKQLDSLSLAYDDAAYFTLEKNQNAQDYFENDVKPIYYADVIPVVMNQLLDYNDKPEGNPYVGHEKMGEQKFIINKARILNHRWIIADFSNGQMWGDVLIRYFVNEDGSISFETIQSFIYSK